MRRKSFDRLISSIGLLLAATLIVAGSLLTWAHGFVHDQVRTQLVQQQIFFPAKDSPAVAGPEFAAMRRYGGQQLANGKQAQTYADHFIAVHLAQIGGGKTYAQLSSAAQADPTDTKLAAQVETMFKGETLRGLLLNAYAFDTMATIAGIAAICSFAAAGVLLVLTGLGFWHAGRVTSTETVFGKTGATATGATESP